LGLTAPTLGLRLLRDAEWNFRKAATFLGFMVGASTFDELNHAPAAAVEEHFRACNGARTWVDAMLRGRPYRDMESMLAMAEKAARSLDWADVQEALDSHPRIGERAAGDSTESVWSRQEQAAVGESDAAIQQALREGNQAYEQRFGQVFLIRAAGRSPEEILAELHRRLANDDKTERTEVTAQLAEITRLRLERLLKE
jgi:2-oxo-4-hydroxy-4-carboxy-5-ureidoimidazoline decarboxylase